MTVLQNYSSPYRKLCPRRVGTFSSRSSSRSIRIWFEQYLTQASGKTGLFAAGGVSFLSVVTLRPGATHILNTGTVETTAELPVL